MNNRIPERFATLKAENRAGLVTFVTAGDPDFDASLKILQGLPGAGADVIELGMPFSDPMADGPAVQASSLRALKSGQNMVKTLDLVRRFRETDSDTPVVLMGYYNPIYIYGNDRFLKDAVNAGVDGLIIVDLPPEEDEELCLPSLKSGLSFIRLATPTTNEARMERVLNHTSGFVYYVSITGITGTREVDADDVRKHVASLRKRTDLPIAVGFGIKTPGQAAAIARVADAAVVGSAIVEQVRENLDASGGAGAALSDRVLDFVRQLADGVRGARKEETAAK